MLRQTLFNSRENFIDLFQNRERRALILSSPGNSHGLFYPLHYYRKELQERFDFSFKEVMSSDLGYKKELIESDEGGTILISFPLRLPSGLLPIEEAVQFFTALKRSEKTRLIFFDTSDHAVSRYFGVLPFVDLFLMPFVFKDPNNYYQKFRGANIFGDYLSKVFGIEPTKINEYHQELFYSEPGRDQLDKIVASWDWVFWKRLVQSFHKQAFRCLPHGERSIDICCRFHPYTGWCRFHRTSVLERLLKLPAKVVASDNKVPSGQYFEEVKSSKISFSPFGWGEICPKDYEAIMMGCLLMKPSVEHLETFSDMHRPFETYVPVKWDLSDLEEKALYYLENDKERERIVANASERYEALFREKRFMNKIGSIL